jgi:hypothetical protein
MTDRFHDCPKPLKRSRPDYREVEKLMKAAKGNRYRHRDAGMAMVAYRAVHELSLDGRCD